MRALCEILFSLPDLEDLLVKLKAGRSPLLLTGLSSVHKAHIIAALRRKTGRPCVILTADDQTAGRLSSDVESFSGEESRTLPHKEQIFYNADGASRESEQKRIEVLYEMRHSPLTFLPAEAAAAVTLPKEILEKAVINLHVGQEIDPQSVIRSLVEAGYTRVDAIDSRSGGQFALRGGILDVYPVNQEQPYRIDFFGDEIDSISIFSTETQRRLNQMSNVTVLPATEALTAFAEGGREGCARRVDDMKARLKKRHKMNDELAANLERDAEALREQGSFAAIDRVYNCIYTEKVSALDYLPEDALILIDDPNRVAESMKNLDWRRGEECQTYLESGLLGEEQTEWMLSETEFWQKIGKKQCLMLDTFTAGKYPMEPRVITSILTKELSGITGGFENAAEEIELYLKAGYAVVFCAGSTQRANLAVDALKSEGLEPVKRDAATTEAIPGRLVITDALVTAGEEYPALKLAILTEGVKNRTAKRFKKFRKKEDGQTIRNYEDLHPGDLVVHDAYGIGQFIEIVPIASDGIKKDYLKIQYQGSDILYVPVTQLDLLAKYVGVGEDAQVKLNKMGGGEWVRAKSKAKAAAKELADKLIQLYAARMKLQGFAFPKDNEWQREFEASFEYEETEDQLRTTDEIKHDMESTVPMDRLLCGDVGFGKTEVALRAVMKCIMGGKQAAILVPTTVLARQHYQTCLHRFRGYPLKIGILSRFTPTSKAAEYLRQMRAGTLDLVIGTHKLLGKNVAFRDLGLLVVDEEQRFGVTHKERLKELSHSVDVLTLTATPIPRTLNMALSGIRDMSVLEEAPQNRFPVQTYVLEHDDGVIRDAVSKELARGGQVYYLYNRVENIARVASRLQQDFPEANVVVGHGQMKPEELNDVMQSMVTGEAQILVCTTIIETGIDIPNVNTLIVENADRMGLAQLHQIRGRVGRSNRRAYAYLTYRKGKVLTEIATKRLSAIREFAEFGAGFRIAMRDMEIRGAGNVLGSEQSGHMISVGYDMYLRLLDEAVVEAKGEKPKARVDCLVDLAVNARISERYIPNAPERLDIYRRIAYIRTSDDAEDMTDELLDRYGEFGDEVRTLMRIALLKNAASEAEIREIKEVRGMINFMLVNPDFMKISALCVMSEFKGRIFLNAGKTPYISLRTKSGEDKIDLATNLVNALKNL